MERSEKLGTVKREKEILLRKRGGITLIALVVTIIVLLILAGVTINLVIGQNGIITRANQAKEVQRAAILEEQVAIWKIHKETARLQGETYDASKEEEEIINKLATQKLLTSEEINKLKDRINNPNREILIGGKYISFKLEEMPKEPAYIGSELTHKEGTVEQGYVVTDGEGNEYVWIPVNNPIAETEAEIATMVGRGMYPMAVKTNGTDGNGRQNYKGVLYEFSLDTEVTPNIVKITPIISTNDSYREPAYLADATNGDSNNTIGITEATLQEEYNEMVEKVIANKGFYIGRYEASYNTTTSMIESKPNTLPMTAEGSSGNMWWGMYEKQKGNIGNANTHMIWGSQYDQVMIFMKEVPNPGKEKPFYILDSTDMGNYGASKTNTGININYKVKNIYDLAGNEWEWTMEASSNCYRIERGGDYNYIGSRNPSSYRYYSYPTGTATNCGTRTTLY